MIREEILAQSKCECMQFNTSFTLELARTLLGWNTHQAIINVHCILPSIYKGMNWEADITIS